MIRLARIIVILYCLAAVAPTRRINYAKILRDLEAKIVGGMPVKIEEFPHNVQFFNSGSMCAGSILTNRAVLTAAHCFDQNKNKDVMTIFAGSRYIFDYEASMYNVFGFYIHQDYNKSVVFSHDIAVVFVDRDFELGKKVKKALLVDSAKWMRDTGKNFIATGWGKTAYGGPVSKLGLMMAKLSLVPQEKCIRYYNSSLLSKDMFCLYGDAIRDTCQGDSGSGIIWKGMVVGVTSHGEECAKKNKPSIYVNVWYFRRWIKNALSIFRKNFCKYLSGQNPMSATKAALNNSC